MVFTQRETAGYIKCEKETALAVVVESQSTYQASRIYTQSHGGHFEGEQVDGWALRWEKIVGVVGGYYRLISTAAEHALLGLGERFGFFTARSGRARSEGRSRASSEPP